MVQPLQIRKENCASHMQSTAYERKLGLTSQTWRPPLALSVNTTETAVNNAAANHAGRSRPCGEISASAHLLPLKREAVAHVVQPQSTSMSSKAEPEPDCHHDSGGSKPNAGIYREPCQLFGVDIVGFRPLGDDLGRLVEDVRRQHHDCLKGI